MINKILSFFYTPGQVWDYKTISLLTIKIFLLFSIFIFIYSAINYLRKYKIFNMLYLKITNDTRAYDRLRRAQIKMEIEEDKKIFSRKKKKNLLSKFYTTIYQTGITENIPGFSEVGFLSIVLFIASILFIFFTFKRSLIVGICAVCLFLIITWYTLSLIAYKRKVKLESQLMQFINDCASVSSQYASIIDIFGVIYENFSYPLREGIEACYVEAKQLNNTEEALNHLKERYNSSQFNFVIDNLKICSKATGDYYTTAKDIAEVISIFCTSHEKKEALLIKAKRKLLIMFCMTLGIIYVLSIFLKDLKTILLSSSFGNILIMFLIFILFYGLNLKAEK